MDKRNLAKFAAKLVVQTTVGAMVVRTLTENVPATQKFKTAEMAGALAGYAASEQLEPLTDKLVDDWFDRRAAKKN